MFERRLKFFLIFLFLVTGTLAMRAGQIQVLDNQHWVDKAAESMKRDQLVESTRGRILDVKGRELAVDMACIDAAVDYRAILETTPDSWVRAKAVERLKSKLGTQYTQAPRAKQLEMRKAEMQSVLDDIQQMWVVLARLSGQTPEQMEDLRRAIVQRVEMRRRYIWFHRYQEAVQKSKTETRTIWQQLLSDGTVTVDQFSDVDVEEQYTAHVVLSDIDSNVSNFLGKSPESYPGLVLRPGIHRVYPYGDVACHLLGRLSRVSKEDLDNDANAGVDEQRAYLPNDLIGRTGIEALCEPTLRGTRGLLVKMAGQDKLLENQLPELGKDVTLTIDIELQREIQDCFRKVKITNPDKTVEEHEMHGAAVIVDLKTNNVLALVSYPGYDLNQFDTLYPTLIRDTINNRLLNRATQYPLETGSIIKPVVGIAAITQGLFATTDTIECTGYLVLNGHKFSVGRCWVASKFSRLLGGNVAHHPIPWNEPHPNGFLTFSDALQRSCNVFFETLGDRLKIEGLSYWYDQFGLGRPTGLGIAESIGRLPSSFHGPAMLRRSTAWFSAIGQGQVSATPIQMANVAATIARNGIWMRPKLLTSTDGVDLRRMADAQGHVPPDSVDLHLNKEALRLAHEGMIRVVNTKAGTGTALKRDDILIAAKTGTAQAAKFGVPERDASGNVVRDDRGMAVIRYLEPSIPGRLNAEAPWYRGFGDDGKDLNHSWVIGFAPANDPKIAFCVMVEYGGSGGQAAAGIAKQSLDACIRHGYLSASGKPVSAEGLNP